MKRLFLLFGILSFSFSFAQVDFGSKSNTIGGSGISFPKSKSPSVLTPNNNFPSSSKSTVKEKEIQFTKSNDFVNPGDPVKNKMNQSEKKFNPDFVKRDQFFGVFKTKSEYIRICYRDFVEPDGDVVSIYTPDLVLINNGILQVECQYIKVRLLKGENKITLLALNQGQSGDNTGELSVYDEQNNLITINQWYLAEGFRASVIIYKE